MSEVPPTVRQFTQMIGDCSIVWTPMMWEGRGFGSMAALRAPARPFTDKEIALLGTFADQAVIAIQNARLFNETKEALEQQTATASVLRVISASPTDVQPVFDEIVKLARELGDASAAAAFRYEGGRIRFVASAGGDTAYVQAFADRPPWEP